MLHEYAIEPRSLTNYRDCLYILEKMGIPNGRYISDFPTPWHKAVIQSCKNDKDCMPIEQKRIVEVLRRVGKCTFNRYRYYDENLEWLANAEYVQEQKPFHAVVAKDNPRKKEFIASISELTELHQLLNVCTGKKIYRTTDDLLKVIGPFLELASQIVFVDPNFSPCSIQYQNTTKAFLSAIRASGNSPKRLEYHTCGDKKESEDFEDFKKDCLKQFSGFLSKGVSLKIYRWSHKYMGDRLHPRYVLTEFGGIRIDYGLDEAKDVKNGKTGQTTDVQLLDTILYLERWQQYSNPDIDYVRTESDFVEVT